MMVMHRSMEWSTIADATNMTNFVNNAYFGLKICVAPLSSSTPGRSVEVTWVGSNYSTGLYRRGSSISSPVSPLLHGEPEFVLITTGYVIGFPPYTSCGCMVSRPIRSKNIGSVGWSIMVESLRNDDFEVIFEIFTCERKSVLPYQYRLEPTRVPKYTIWQVHMFGVSIIGDGIKNNW